MPLNKRRLPRIKMGYFVILKASLLPPARLPKYKNRNQFTFRKRLDCNDTKVNTSAPLMFLQITSFYGPVLLLNLQNPFNWVYILPGLKTNKQTNLPRCTEAHLHCPSCWTPALSIQAHGAHQLPATRSFSLIISLTSHAFCTTAAIFLAHTGCKAFPDHSPQSPCLAVPAGLGSGAGEKTQVLLIAKEGQNCRLGLARSKTPSREQHPLGNLSFLRQGGHALISLQRWCEIPPLGWRLTPVQPQPFAAQQNLLLKQVFPLY